MDEVLYGMVGLVKRGTVIDGHEWRVPDPVSKERVFISLCCSLAYL